MKIENITEKELKNVLSQFERFVNTYFWTPPACASMRRAEENRNSNIWNFIADGKKVICEIKVSCSCKNYYSSRSISVDGQSKKMMVPFLKTLLKNGEFAEVTV